MAICWGGPTWWIRALHEVFIERVNALAKRRGLSVNRLADACGISRSYMSKLLRGVSSPSLAVIAKIAGGRRELIAVIEERNTVTKILDHVGIPSTPPRFEPARSPPEERWLDDSWA